MPNPYHAQSSKHETDKNVCPTEDSRTASWSAAGGRCCGLHCAHEGADEFAVDLRADRFRIEAGGFEEFAGFFDSINASRLHVNGFKTCASQLFAILIFFQCAGNAADPQFYAFANVGRNFTANDDIRNSETPAGLEYSK